MLKETDLRPELDRVMAAMSKTDPADDKYKNLELRYKALFDMAMTLRNSDLAMTKQADDLEHRKRELDLKAQKDQLSAEQNAKDLDYKINSSEFEAQIKKNEMERKFNIEDAKLDLEYAKMDVDKMKIEHAKQSEEAKLNLESEKIEVEKARIAAEQEKSKSDSKKAIRADAINVAGTVAEVVTTGMRVVGGITTALVSAKVTMVLAKAVLSDEAAGNLIHSKVFNYIPKMNLGFRLL